MCQASWPVVDIEGVKTVALCRHEDHRLDSLVGPDRDIDGGNERLGHNRPVDHVCVLLRQLRDIRGRDQRISGCPRFPQSNRARSKATSSTRGIHPSDGTWCRGHRFRCATTEQTAAKTAQQFAGKDIVTGRSSSVAPPVMNPIPQSTRNSRSRPTRELLRVFKKRRGSLGIMGSLHWIFRDSKNNRTHNPLTSRYPKSFRFQERERARSHSRVVPREKPTGVQFSVAMKGRRAAGKGEIRRRSAVALGRTSRRQFPQLLWIPAQTMRWSGKLDGSP